ncbi:MAG: hypothetical protein R3B45_15835 [Bdellovibrionota bacterium]
MTKLHEIVLSSEASRAKILPSLGGTVTSLKLLTPDELLFQLDWQNLTTPSTENPSKNLWPGGGIPILFPFAGRVWTENNKGHYRWDGIEFPMPIHGFQYHQSQPVIEQPTNNKLILTYRYLESTLAVYPWKYELAITYKLEKNQFTITLNISNFGKTSTKTTNSNKPLSDNQYTEQNHIMPISPGFHPYFKLDHSLADSRNHCQIAITDRRFHHVTEDGGAGKLSNNFLKPPYEAKNPFFQNLILAKKELLNNLDQVSLIDITKGTNLTLVSNSMPFWVLWGLADKNFYCLEPWTSFPNAVSSREDNTHGSGLITLRRNEAFNCSFTIIRDN